MTFSVVVPTLNAGRSVRDVLSSISAQTAPPTRLLIVDSLSDDGTAEEFRVGGAEVLSIARDDFDHGATRQLAIEHVGEAPVVVFLTQDSIPADENAFARLVAAFDDETVAAAYGRQLPREGAGIAEAHARRFNYPETSRVKSLQDAAELGIKTPFLSNSFAAYRVSALREVGGFPRPAHFGEDMHAGAKLLLAGYRIAYVAEAQVRHSHSYSLGEEFRRYFDIGAFHARNPWIMGTFGAAGREGRAYLRSELRYALDTAPAAIPGLLLRSALKLAGMQIGKRERLLPRALKRRLSMNPRFWDHDLA